MQNFRWQWCVKEIYLEENSHSCLTGIGRQKKIIKPQCCLDDRLRCHCTEEESYCQHHWCCVGLTKIRARQTPAVTEITLQRRDLRLDSVIVELRRVPWDRERRLDKRSGVTRIFMSTVLKRKPRKTMEVKGTAFVGDVWRPRSRNNWPVALKASANLVGNFVSEPPELSRPLRTRALQVPFEVWASGQPVCLLFWWAEVGDICARVEVVLPFLTPFSPRRSHKSGEETRSSDCDWAGSETDVVPPTCHRWPFCYYNFMVQS